MKYPVVCREVVCWCVYAWVWGGGGVMAFSLDRTASCLFAAFYRVRCVAEWQACPTSISDREGVGEFFGVFVLCCFGQERRLCLQGWTFSAPLFRVLSLFGFVTPP